jgi:uncharacterized membrane protein YeaQ/YmgE (transglycosylase-associated protein family)
LQRDDPLAVSLAVPWVHESDFTGSEGSANHPGWRFLMSIIAWIVLGAIAGYLAGFLVRGDEGMGVIAHIVLGSVGALFGGFLAGVLFHTNPIDGPLDVSSIVTATIGAVIAVVALNAVTDRTRTGRGVV